MTEIVLKPCPFCQEAVQFRKALHISDGNVDSIIHAAPTNCPMVVFEDGSVDESILGKWNTRALPAQGEPVDPTADPLWNSGVDFTMSLLCDYLGVDQNAVTWDAATETVDGDVSAVIGNILRAKFGEDWSPDVGAGEAIFEECAEIALEHVRTAYPTSSRMMEAYDEACRDIAEAIRVTAANRKTMDAIADAALLKP